jgi:hypothetical protein
MFECNGIVVRALPDITFLGTFPARGGAPRTLAFGSFCRALAGHALARLSVVRDTPRAGCPRSL